MKSGNGNKPMLKPAIVIGLGGTGNQVVRRLKKHVESQYGDTPTLINFLVADTDEDTFNDHSWAELAVLEDIEQAPLYDPRVPFSDVRDNRDAYPEIHDWLLPAVDVGLLDRQDGAGQIRMLGRVALYKSFAFLVRRIDHFFDQCQKIQTLLDAMYRYDFNVETDPVVYLVSSVCGGQGAGSFIDAAVALRVLAAGRFPRLNLIGLLTLPSVYADLVPRENWGKICANTHAAMKEMDYLMHNSDKSRMRFRLPPPIGRTITPNAPLFDLCYLVDDHHHRGSLNGDTEVYDQIAAQLFLEIGTPFGARSDSIRVNLNTVAGIERDRVYNTGRRYSGFGNHTISLNRESIVELAAIQSACSMINDRLLGSSHGPGPIETTVQEFMTRHRICESETNGLLNRLVTRQEVNQEFAAESYSLGRPDHGIFARDLWARFDAFWLRRAQEMRDQMERRARAELDGEEGKRGLFTNLDQFVDDLVRERGVAPAHAFTEVILEHIRALETKMRTEHREGRDQTQRSYQETEEARNAIAEIGQQLERLRIEAEHVGFLVRIWRLFGIAVTFGLWRPGAADGENRARQFHELTIQAEGRRSEFLSSHNRAVEHRLAQESLDVAASFFSEVAARSSQVRDRLKRVMTSLQGSNRVLLEELNELAAGVKRSRFVDGNTMRRDLAADYVDLYQQSRDRAVADEVYEWLLPESRPPLDLLEECDNPAQIREKFRDLYTHDIVLRNDRDSLVRLIDRFHSNNGGVPDRIAEGLRFCLPFWDIRVPGNQFTTEVLLIGLDHEHQGVKDYLGSYAAGQRGQVLAHVVPTGQDSLILISRIAHGASYYWHAQDEIYFREYASALQTAPYPVHLHDEWRKLPEPIPDPRKYERRVFALAVAYEVIAIRGAACYVDLLRRCSLVGTLRQDSPDWKTIPLLEATAVAGWAPSPAAPAREDLLYDADRAEAMHEFIDGDRQVAAVRDKLTGLFNEQGREATRKQIERYCLEVLKPAIDELPDDDRARRQLEVELVELFEVIAELKPVSGRLRLA